MNKRGIQKEGLAKFYARFLAFCSAILRVQKKCCPRELYLCCRYQTHSECGSNLVNILLQIQCRLSLVRILPSILGVKTKKMNEVFIAKSWGTWSVVLFHIKAFVVTSYWQKFAGPLLLVQRFTLAWRGTSSSIARGGGGGRGGLEPPHWLVKYAKSHVFVAFEANFWLKIENSPPPKENGCRSREVDVVMRCEKAFEFWILAEKSNPISVKTFFFFGDHLFLGWKTWISEFGRKIRLNFGEDLFFFFWRPPVFGLKKRLKFRAFREISSQFLDKPCETDSRTMKIRVKAVCTFLTL